jgi:hypothetical protein
MSTTILLMYHRAPARSLILTPKTSIKGTSLNVLSLKVFSLDVCENDGVQRVFSDDVPPLSAIYTFFAGNGALSREGSAILSVLEPPAICESQTKAQKFLPHPASKHRCGAHLFAMAFKS